MGFSGSYYMVNLPIRMNSFHLSEPNSFGLAENGLLPLPLFPKLKCTSRDCAQPVYNGYTSTGETTLVTTTPKFDFLVEKDVMVPMRDGIQLAADIYRPAINGRLVEGRFPVILERTPYGKAIDSRSERSRQAIEKPKTRAEVAALFVERGFIVIYQDCRGRYNSQGVFQKYLDDAADGYDTCAWIIRQPWSSGQIGTKGLSYAAHTQAALASFGAPGLAAMWLDSGGFSNAYSGGIRQGGAFELKQVTWAYRQALNSSQVRSDPQLRARLEAVDLFEWFQKNVLAAWQLSPFVGSRV
jgi:predicted acyl esterase